MPVWKTVGGSDHYPTFHLKSKSLEESSRIQGHFGHRPFLPFCSLPPPDALSFLSSLLWVCIYPSLKRLDWLKKTKQILTTVPQLLQSSRGFVQQRHDDGGITEPPSRLRELMLWLFFSIIHTIHLSWPGTFSICRTTCLFCRCICKSFACMSVSTTHTCLVSTEFRRRHLIPCTGARDNLRGGMWALEVHPQSVPCESKYAKLLNVFPAPE